MAQANTEKSQNLLSGSDFDPGVIHADGTIYAGISPDTGQALYVTPEDAPLTLQWEAAMKYAAELDAHGHKDWSLPTRAELNILFNNRAAIGGFNMDWHWSSAKYAFTHAWAQDFGKEQPHGCQGYGSKNITSAVRCVRRVPLDLSV